MMDAGDGMKNQFVRGALTEGEKAALGWLQQVRDQFGAVLQTQRALYGEGSAVALVVAKLVVEVDEAEQYIKGLGIELTHACED